MRSGPGWVILCPSIVTNPSVGKSKPATILSSVDFPQPECPIKEINSPFLISRSMPLRAMYLPPSDKLKTFSSCSTAIKVDMIFLPLCRFVRSWASALQVRSWALALQVCKHWLHFEGPKKSAKAQLRTLFSLRGSNLLLQPSHQSIQHQTNSANVDYS